MRKDFPCSKQSRSASGTVFNGEKFYYGNEK
jgi:hypothetical protein